MIQKYKSNKPPETKYYRKAKKKLVRADLEGRDIFIEPDLLKSDEKVWRKKLGSKKFTNINYKTLDAYENKQD